MEIHFANRRTKRIFESERDLRREHGQLAPKIMQRIGEMMAVDNLRDLQLLPGTDCHRLVGHRADQWAVRLTGNYRLVFEPVEAPSGVDPDWSEVEAVRVIEVTDYH